MKTTTTNAITLLLSWLIETDSIPFWFLIVKVNIWVASCVVGLLNKIPLTTTPLSLSLIGLLLNTFFFPEIDRPYFTDSSFSYITKLTCLITFVLENMAPKMIFMCVCHNQREFSSVYSVEKNLLWVLQARVSFITKRGLEDLFLVHSQKQFYGQCDRDPEGYKTLSLLSSFHT